jgi:Transglycosylase-like domain
MARVRLCLLTLAAGLAGSAAVPEGAEARAQARKLASIADHRAETWHWQRLMGVRRTPSRFTERRIRDARYLHWMQRVWRRRAEKARRRAARPPHRRAWRCIKRFESHPHQGWATRTGNGFYGGLQMDLGFQRTYGRFLLRRKGTADRWNAIEQMWVAERAHRTGRGFYPWPNSAWACGLL